MIFRKIDEPIIVGMQKSYLWLLDRTGIYVATIGLLIFAGSLCMIDWHDVPVWCVSFMLLIAAVNLLLLGQRYMLQGSGKNEVFNAASISYIECVYLRWFFNIEVGIFLVTNLISLDWRGVLLDILIIAYNYVPCIMIRDREKKPFWETKSEAVLEGT